MKILYLVAASLGLLVLFQTQIHRPNTTPYNDAPESPDQPDDQVSGWASVDLWGMTSAAIDSRTVNNAIGANDQAGANVAAFLAMIATAEGTDRAADPYRVCYGYVHTIADFSDHPAVTGEWKGVGISSLGPQYAGKISTAAGRYQMLKPTWLDCKRALDLPDFGPGSQDAAALYLIKRRRALDDVQAGRFQDAVAKCANTSPPGKPSNAVWASLPGAGNGQPERRMATLIDAYTTAGGITS